MDSLCRAVRDLNAPSGAGGGGGGGKGGASAAREKKPVNAHVVKSGMLRFNFMLGCCNPGTLPDAHLIAALLDLVSIHTPCKGQVFPYSLPSVGPGADPGVQAVNPQVT